MSESEYVSTEMFDERTGALNNRFEVLESRVDRIEYRLNWLIGLALIGLGMLSLNLIVQLGKAV
jgi:hypothetical protein